jgi:hypothetical protein
LNSRTDEHLGGILDFLSQRQKINEQTHVMVEQPSSWLTNLFGCNAQLLLHLPKKIKRMHSKFTTYENLEVRRVAAAAHNIIKSPFEVYRDWVIDGTKKTLGSFTVQDVLDEFANTKQILSDYYSQQNKITADIYTKCMTESDNCYKNLLQIMESKNISPDIGVLDYTKNNNLSERTQLASAILDTFSPFFDLNTIRVILTSSHKNMIVVAGAAHTRGVCSVFQKLNACSLYTTVFDIGPKGPEEISIDQIQKGLSMQEKSLMRLYAPAMISKTLIATFCFLLCAVVIQAMA